MLLMLFLFMCRKQFPEKHHIKKRAIQKIQLMKTFRRKCSALSKKHQERTFHYNTLNGKS